MTWTNIHLPPEKPTMDYHRILARLVTRFTPAEGRVIDIGAGLGNVLRLVRGQSPKLELHAADPSDDCLSHIQTEVAQVRLHPIDEHEDSIRRIEPARFDTAVLCHTLEHTRRPVDTLQAVLDLLCPGGHLVLAVPNLVSPHCLLLAAFRRRYSNLGHVFAWDRSHWLNFLENIVHADVVLHTQDEVRIFLPQRLAIRFRPLKAIERALARLFPWWSHSHISVVRKAS